MTARAVADWCAVTLLRIIRVTSLVVIGLIAAIAITAVVGAGAACALFAQHTLLGALGHLGNESAIAAAVCAVTTSVRVCEALVRGIYTVFFACAAWTCVVYALLVTWALAEMLAAL